VNKIRHIILECIVLVIYTFRICSTHGRWNTLKANRPSASQEIPCILWNPKVLSRIHNSPSSVQSMTPHLTSCKSSLILSYLLCQDRPSGLFSSDLPIKILYVTSLDPIHATCSTYPIILDMITPIIFSDCRS